MTMKISSAFDSGNIWVRRIEGDEADLDIRLDADSGFYQWFHFRVSGAKGRPIRLNILNAGGSAYPDGWPDYQARVSDDHATWRLAHSSYSGGVLSIAHVPQGDVVWFAYFAPYGYDRHQAMVARMAAKEGVALVELGQSLDGRPIDCLRMGTGATQIWLYARQHPGESMAEWWAEGALEWLTDPGHQQAIDLRRRATIHVVPNMNPDGSVRGHLRTNAAGVNLNREWADPSPERSPEVLCTLAEMDRTGVHWAMDVHGDEAIPACFFAGFEGIPNWTEAQGGAFYAFRDALAAHTPDFQTQLGYGVSAPGKANLSMSTNQLANRFADLGCVAATLEMPFKDHASNADAVHGWSPERSKRLAHACLEVLAGRVA